MGDEHEVLRLWRCRIGRRGCGIRRCFGANFGQGGCEWAGARRVRTGDRSDAERTRNAIASSPGRAAGGGGLARLPARAPSRRPPHLSPPRDEPHRGIVIQLERRRNRRTAGPNRCGGPAADGVLRAAADGSRSAAAAADAATVGTVAPLGPRVVVAPGFPCPRRSAAAATPG